MYLSIQPQVIVHIDHGGTAGHAGVTVAPDGDLGGGHPTSEGLLVQRELPRAVHIVGLLEGLVLVARYLRCLGRRVGRGVGNLRLHTATVNVLELAVLKLGRESKNRITTQIFGL